MKNALIIFGFTVLVSAFYSYVGQMVPQKITYPPEETEFGENMTTDDLVTIGGELVSGKGTCLTCHTMGESGALRFPDLGNIGAIAGSRNPDMDDVEYLAESLYEPNDFIVEGFAGGMPAIGRPPINLNDQEILAVIAYLQSLGGTPTVTIDTELRWQGQAPAPTPAATASAGPSTEDLDGPTLMGAYLCTTCHSFDAPTPLVGPSLYDLGKRMSKSEIYEALMDPDAVIAEGYTGGVMPQTLQAAQFFDKVSAKQLNTMVEYLASLQGE